jgi:hypothetical protein
MTARLAAAIVLMLGAGTAAGADLGRLFFTPAQRATLDNARKQNIRIEIGSENPQAAAPVARNISVNGVVRRSDGKSTVWINNRAVTDRQTGGIGVSPGKNDSRVKLTVPESGRSVDLKVGQSVEIVSGTIEEGYARRIAPNTETKAVPGTETTASGVEKGAPAQTVQPSKTDEAATKRAARNKELDLLHDLQLNSGAGSK